MKYANHIPEMINAFSPAPLQREQMKEFYCEDTMEYRTSDKYDSPIKDIFDGCKNSDECSAYLLLGHRGCGKSTELNRMSQELCAKDYSVKTINCSMDLDLFNIVYSDLFILMGEARKEYRKRISVRSSEWIGILGCVAEEISKKKEGKRPIIIFEDLDKLNPEDAWKVFYNYAAVLSGMKFPVIYTFPIGLSYDARFSAMESYFITKTLPMIKISTIENKPFQEGIDIIGKIVSKRADLALFDEDVLETLIQYTGGSLRDLFHVINASAKRADRG